MEAVTSTVPDESDRFVVPVGIDPEGNPVRPSLAQKTVPYKCPNCIQGLILRKGDVRAHHFAHRDPNPGEPECNPETRLHKSAKAVVMKVVSDVIAGTGGEPVIYMKHRHCEDISHADFVRGVTQVAEEYRLPSGRILDIAILKGDKVALGVEIFVTHRVDAKKRGALTCPWIELNAKDVVESKFRWFSLQSEGVFPACWTCKEIAAPRPPRPKNPAPKKTKVYRLKTDEEMRQLPYIRPNNRHATTAMPEQKVEMCLEKLPEVLDCFEPPVNPLELPGGGIMENPKRSSEELRSIIAHGGKLDIYQKKATLWRISEYLQAAKPWIRGGTLAEKRKNMTLVNEAIGWLTK